MKTNVISNFRDYQTVTHPIQADDLKTCKVYQYSPARYIVTDYNEEQRADLLEITKGKETPEGIVFAASKWVRDRLHIWQNNEAQKQRAAILGDGWQWIEGLRSGTEPGDLITCIDGTRGRVTKSDPESCCIEFETADGRRLSVAGYFRKKRTRLMFANGTRENHAQGICINQSNGAKELEEHREIFHKREKYEVVAEGPDFITIRYTDYDSPHDDGVRTYWLAA